MPNRSGRAVLGSGSDSGATRGGAPTPLALIASAIAGRQVHVMLNGSAAWCDGRRIHIAVGQGPPDVPASPIDATALHGVIGQASLIAAGSFDPEPTRLMARAPKRVRERFTVLELVRARVLTDATLPASYRAAVAPIAAAVRRSSSVEESLSRAFGPEPLPEPPPWLGQMRPRLSPRRAERQQERARDASDPASAAAAEADRGKLADLLSAPALRPLSQALQRLASAKQAPPGAGTGKEATHGLRVDHGHVRHTSQHPTLPRVLDVGGQSTLGRQYPEWDQRWQRYRTDWCTVGAFDPAIDGSLPSLGVGPDRALIRALSRVALSHRTHGGELLGDDVDLNFLVDHHVDLVTGAGDVAPRVYRADRRTRRELAVLLLLDATGSTTDSTSAGSVFDLHRQLVHELTTALDAIGARVATQAFYSRGRGNIRMLRCKAFDETWGARAHERLRSIQPTGFTRLGAVLRDGTRQLVDQSGTSRRLLIVVGDGIPFDDGYEGEYAIQDSRRALQEACAHAVGALGISATATREGRSIWPADSFHVATDVRRLTDHLPALLTHALAHAAQPPRPEELPFP